jgi:hypothetical protein
MLDSRTNRQPYKIKEMKYLLFLLLLSSEAMGQQDSAYLLIEETDLEGRPLDKERLKVPAPKISPSISKQWNKGPRIGKPTSAIVQHAHKWVELHQDTITTIENRSIWDLGDHIDFIHSQNWEEGWATHSTLICLICHQEKKKVIHYKRDK